MIVFEDEENAKPLLESNSILAIQEHFERKAADEYAGVVRKRNEAHMKQVPTYFFLLIAFFIYDDIWFTYEEYPITHVIMLLFISTIALLYAIGQGPVVRQIVDIVYQKLMTTVGKVKDLKGGDKKKEEKKE